MQNETETNQSPTSLLYQTMETAFDHFNARLFEGKLPPCVITMRSSSRYRGYHHSKRFISLTGAFMDEIGMHPGYFAVQPVEVVLSTLVHEMVHHWQHHFGKCTNSNPHNRQWAAKMQSIGLEPTHTGLPGGRLTGRSVTHFIVPGAQFDEACKELLKDDFRLPWMDRHVPIGPDNARKRQSSLRAAGIELELTAEPAADLFRLVVPGPALFEPVPKREKTRFRYECPICASRAWASSQANLICGQCDVSFEQAMKG